MMRQLAPSSGASFKRAERYKEAARQQSPLVQHSFQTRKRRTITHVRLFFALKESIAIQIASQQTAYVSITARLPRSGSRKSA
jgi:hypothetical protein